MLFFTGTVSLTMKTRGGGPANARNLNAVVVFGSSGPCVLAHPTDFAGQREEKGRMQLCGGRKGGGAPRREPLQRRVNFALVIFF